MTDLDGIPGPGLEEYAEKAPKSPCPSCDRDLSYPGQPGHRCYTYAERAATLPDARSATCALRLTVSTG